MFQIYSIRNKLYQLLTAAVFITLYNSPLQALEVGDIQLQSKLGQPLFAVVQLTHENEITDQEIIIVNAPDAVYKQMGVNAPSQFLNLQFKLQTNGQLTITTRAPIKEPYLNFVLQFRWPEGEVNREYNLLIDPG